jgi:hypothetical protein
MASHRVWSWDKNNHLWMEVAQGSKREMTEVLETKRRAAARILPDARFTMTTMGAVPEGPPDE